MKSNKRVCVKPMPSGAVPTVDEDHADVRVVDEGIGERHPHRTRADHHVVGFKHLQRHRPMLTARRTLVNATCGADVPDFPRSEGSTSTTSKRLTANAS